MKEFVLKELLLLVLFLLNDPFKEFFNNNSKILAVLLVVLVLLITDNGGLAGAGAGFGKNKLFKLLLFNGETIGCIALLIYQVTLGVGRWDSVNSLYALIKNYGYTLLLFFINI